MIRASLSIATATVLALTGPSQAAEPKRGVWGLSDHADISTGDRIVSIGVATNEGLRLTFQCARGTLMARITATTQSTENRFTTSDIDASVTWQVDDRSAARSDWRVVPGGAAGRWSVMTLDPEPFVDALASGGRYLTVVVHGVTSIIELQKTKDGFDTINAACGRGKFSHNGDNMV